MTWYYLLDGKTQGPVPEPELLDLRRQNVVTAETLVWMEGMPDWLPFQHTALVPGMTGKTHRCAECGKRFPEEEMLQYEGAWVCAACKPLFFQRIREGADPRESPHRRELVYASIGSRFLAVVIDSLIHMGIGLMFLLPYLIMASWVVGPEHRTVAQGFSRQGGYRFFVIFLEYVFPALYSIFFIGRYGATPGKMLMKIKVVDADGSPISYGRATGRYFARMLSALILYIGFFMAFWDDQKRTLHDRICSTRVITTSTSRRNSRRSERRSSAPDGLNRSPVKDSSGSW